MCSLNKPVDCSGNATGVKGSKSDASFLTVAHVELLHGVILHPLNSQDSIIFLIFFQSLISHSLVSHSQSQSLFAPGWGLCTRGCPGKADHELTQFKEIVLASDLPNELLYGRVGFLWGLHILKQAYR
ncbi:hypothetical protein LWI28_024064 [Acer negundo]|uniref:Uncharacterized protein n=1 Tax=Acer negundo TaxID=4023 RepID=A0AAD5J6M5_ACENE|nr:hypothetical protein LWI28_024064 [Acer negundo]